MISCCNWRCSETKLQLCWGCVKELEDIAERSENEIEEFKSLSFDVGLMHSTILKTKMNKNLHCIMRYMADNLLEIQITMNIFIR